MRDRAREFSEGLQHFAAICGWLFGGALLGALMAAWKAPGSEVAMVSSALLFPATILLGWMMMFPLALLMLPFLIPRFIRWLREPQPPPQPQAEPAGPRRATAAGWVFVAAAVPTSLIAGLIAGAPLSFLLAGLLYGIGLRYSAPLQDVSFG